MAVASDRFSIRDYAAKMRIVDLAKSWPFIGEKVERTPLPPISICRFRWWMDELSSAKSAAEVAETKAAEAPMNELVKKQDEIIKHHESIKSPPGSTSTKTTTGNEDFRSLKAKTRIPKKRSIVELFASAPKIDPVDQSNGEDGYGDDKEEEGKLIMRKRKGKLRKGAIKMEIRALKKEKFCKPKRISSSHSHLLQDPINRKTFRKTAEDVESKKLVKVKTLQHKQHILETPNLISIKPKVIKKLPISSILKNKNRFTSARKIRKKSNAKTVQFIKHRCKTSRHFTFSEKDINGHRKKSSSIDIPQFKSLCKIFSNVLTKSSVMNNSSKVHELPATNDGPQVVNATDEDTVAGLVDETDKSSSQKNHSSDSLGNVNHRKLVNSSNSSCSSADKASMAVLIDLNHATENCNDLDCFNLSSENLSTSCTNSVDLDFKGTSHKNGSSTSTEFHLQGLPKKSLAFTIPTERNFESAFNATDLITTTKNPSPHSSTCCLIACNENNEQQCRQYFDVDMKCCHHIAENQLGLHCSQKDLLGNYLGFSGGSNKFRGSAFLSNSVSTSKSKSTGEEFFTLPLDKQGEHIQTHPGMKFVGPYNKQTMDLASSISANIQFEHDINANRLNTMKERDHECASYQNDQLDWCQNQYNPIRQRVFTEFINPERLNIRNNEPVEGKYEFLHSHASKTKLSFHDRKICDRTLDSFKEVDLRGKCNLACHIEPAVQPTIRLMGQNVVVGRSCRDCHSSIMPENYLSKQRALPEFVANATCGSSTCSLPKLQDSPSIFYHTSEHLKPIFDSHIDDHGSKSLPRKNIFSTTGNNTFKVDVDSQALPHKAFLNKTDKFIGNGISGEKSKRHQDYPTIASYEHNIPQHMLFSSIDCDSSHGIPCRTFVTPQSQVRNNVHENTYQPVLIQQSEEPPKWLFQAKHERRNQLSSPPYSDQSDLNQPCRLSGTYLIPHISPYSTHMVPFSADSMSPAKSSTFAQNSSQSSFISAVTATDSISESRKSTVIMNKKRERSYSNFTGFIGPVDAYKFQNGPVECANVFMNSATRPYFGSQANYSIPVEPLGTDMIRDHPLLDYAAALDVQKGVNELEDLSNAESSSYSRWYKESAVVPTKLVAGANHALKPRQKIDDGDFRPAH